MIPSKFLLYIMIGITFSIFSVLNELYGAVKQSYYHLVTIATSLKSLKNGFLLNFP